MNRAVFLDRDGVLTRALVRDGKAYAPVTPAEMEIEADAPAALARLKAAGFLLIIVTNQPDVARGVTRREDVEAMHAILRAALPLDDVFVCYHDNADACDCRKPQPGMLLAGRCCARDRSGTPASWSATAGVTSTPAPPRAAAPCGSTAATMNRRPRTCPMPAWTACAPPRTGSSRVKSGERPSKSRAWNTAAQSAGRADNSLGNP